MDLTLCPECGGLAEVLWRDVVSSTDAPVELAKIICVRRHWFLLPVAHLERDDVDARHPARQSGGGS
jgi:hypothetical protein